MQLNQQNMVAWDSDIRRNGSPEMKKLFANFDPATPDPEKAKSQWEQIVSSNPELVEREYNNHIWKTHWVPTVERIKKAGLENILESEEATAFLYDLSINAPAKVVPVVRDALKYDIEVDSAGNAVKKTLKDEARQQRALKDIPKQELIPGLKNSIMSNTSWSGRADYRKAALARFTRTEQAVLNFKTAVPPAGSPEAQTGPTVEEIAKQQERMQYRVDPAHAAHNYMSIDMRGELSAYAQEDLRAVATNAVTFRKDFAAERERLAREDKTGIVRNLGEAYMEGLAQKRLANPKDFNGKNLRAVLKEAVDTKAGENVSTEEKDRIVDSLMGSTVFRRSLMSMPFTTGDEEDRKDLHAAAVSYLNERQKTSVLNRNAGAQELYEEINDAFRGSLLSDLSTSDQDSVLALQEKSMNVAPLYTLQRLRAAQAIWKKKRTSPPLSCSNALRWNRLLWLPLLD